MWLTIKMSNFAMKSLANIGKNVDKRKLHNYNKINNYLLEQFFRKNSCKNFYTIKSIILNFPKNNNILNKGGT